MRLVLMLNIDEVLSKVSDRHKLALLWFVAHRDEERSWPKSLPDGTLLASKAKGIYKPSWTKYALSVRESLGGPYTDRSRELRPDGTWSYDYFQENTDPSLRNSEYTNRGLVECMNDVVPVGVFRQVARKPFARYRILGLALIVGWDAGYFHLEGFSTAGLAYGRRAQAEIEALVGRLEISLTEDGRDYDESLEDGRDRAIASVVRRRGQPAFRRALIEAYGAGCAISGCDAEAALEACHIKPYRGPQSNSLPNGLLLRADLHTLFDLGLLAVDTASMTVLVAPELAASTYSELAGKVVLDAGRYARCAIHGSAGFASQVVRASEEVTCPPRKGPAGLLETRPLDFLHLGTSCNVIFAVHRTPARVSRVKVFGARFREVR